MTIYMPLAGLVEVNPFTADWRTLVGSSPATPSTPPPQTAAKTSWLDSAMSFADKAVNFVDGSATKAVNIMEKYGQVKGKAKVAAFKVNSSYNKNITETPRFLGEDWIPGIPNIAVIGGGAGLVVLLLMMKKGNA